MKLLPMPLVATILGEGEMRTSSGGWSEWEVWAQKELMSVGSDLCAKFSNLQVTLLSSHILC